MKTMKSAMLAGALLLAQFAVAQSGPALANGQKAPIHGLVSMGDISVILEPTKPNTNATAEALVHPGVYSAVAIVLRWSHLAPTPTAYDFSDVDKALQEIAAYNAKYPKTPVVGKLRVFGGPNAPNWVKALDGGPVPLKRKGTPLIVGKFWSADYTKAWRALQVKLAAKYDDNPLIQEVAISSCGSTSAEPFVARVQDENLEAFKKASYSDAEFRTCLSGALDDYAPWKHVALDFTFNELRTLHADDTITQSPEFTVEVMEDFRKRMGARGVTANHGLEQPMVPSVEHIAMEMKKLGPPMAFQTDGLKVDWDETVKLAKELGATEFEMWDSKEADGAAHVPFEQIKRWTVMFPYTNSLAK